MRDIRSILLATVTLTLVGTWVYHFYDKNRYSLENQQPRVEYVTDTAAVTQAIRDSMQHFYASMAEPDSLSANTDSLRKALNDRLTEILELRARINTILRKANATKEELNEARTLIQELQVKVDDFKRENENLEIERARMSDVLGTLNEEIKDLKSNVQRLDAQNQKLSASVDLATTFVASEVRLVAMNVKGSSREVETTSVRKADKFAVSFILQNNVTGFSNAEIVVVITDPENQVIIDPVYDSGEFTTRQDGKKTYTRKMTFDYTRGEQKRLIFSLDPNKFVKGRYALSIYHNGTRIGDAVDLLN